MDKVLAILIGWPLAFLFLKYRRPIKEFTGDFAWAEKYLGMGGTNTFIVLFGVLIFILSLMYALGTLEALLQATFGRFTMTK